MSSLGGSASNGNRARSAATVCSVSSTDNVVCDNHATFAGSATTAAAACSGPSTSRICPGASPVVPTTSSCPACPTSTMSYPAAANRRASLCTFVTSGHVASIARSPRAAASARTPGATPCAENTTTAPAGTSPASSTNTAPRASNAATTCVLCTICFRTYTGAPYTSSATSTACTARSTPAQ